MHSICFKKKLDAFHHPTPTHNFSFSQFAPNSCRLIGIKDIDPTKTNKNGQLQTEEQETKVRMTNNKQKNKKLKCGITCPVLS